MLNSLRKTFVHFCWLSISFLYHKPKPNALNHVQLRLPCRRHQCSQEPLWRCHNTNQITFGGCTQEIPAERDTIQGGTLSPFLFLLYMETLLRWFHAGGRGYKHSCIQDQSPIDTNFANIISSTSFVNLTSETNTIQDLRVQARKLTLYSDWVALIVSGKTNVTSALYSPPPKAKKV